MLTLKLAVCFPVCGEEESNLHGIISHQPLKLARLTIPPPPHIFTRLVRPVRLVNELALLIYKNCAKNTNFLQNFCRGNEVRTRVERLMRPCWNHLQSIPR